MPVARFQLPDGRVARFEVPDGTTPEQAQSLIQTQLSAMEKPAAAELPESLRPRVAAPEGIPGGRQEAGLYSQVRPFVAPVVEALGAGGGALLGGVAGTFGAGPIGTLTGGVAGAGLGYGAAKEALELADVYFGGKAPRQGAAQITEPVRNVLEGAIFEASGRVAGPLIAKGVGKLADLRQVPKAKAANVAKEALGVDLPAVVNALRTAPPGTSVAEATALIQNPAWQALVKDSLESTPQGAQYLNKLKSMTEEEGVNALAKLAGGATATQARAAAEGQKRALTTVTEPMRQAAIKGADIGQDVARLSREAGQLEAEAAGKVEDVRRLVAAGQTAEDAAKRVYAPMGQPRVPGRYTYPGELAVKADEWASAAAQGSLDAGQAARQANAAVDALKNAGFKPLETTPLIERVGAIGQNPEFAGNDVMQAAVRNLQNDLAQWTNVHGIVPAAALDAIRKNSVNAAVRDLMKGQDPSTQAKAAASVMTRIRPLLVDAMEASGGKGYRDYLEAYAEGAQKIAEKKLSGEALRLWKNDKDGFIRLVQGESPDVVEKFLGPGKYDVATELADSTMEVLRKQAQSAMNRVAASKQASEGQKALASLLEQNTSMIRLPSFLKFWVSAANKGLAGLEDKIGRATTKTLSTAMQNPQTAANLLESLPAAERERVLQIIADPSKWTAPSRATVTGGTAAAVNALAPERNVENEFAR